MAWNNDEGKWMCIRDYYGANFKKASSFNPADVAYQATSGIGATLTYKTNDFDMKKLYDDVPRQRGLGHPLRRLLGPPRPAAERTWKSAPHALDKTG